MEFEYKKTPHQQHQILYYKTGMPTLNHTANAQKKLIFSYASPSTSFSLNPEQLEGQTTYDCSPRSEETIEMRVEKPEIHDH